MKKLRKFGITLFVAAIVSLSVAFPADARVPFYDTIDGGSVTAVGGEVVPFTLLQQVAIAETVFHTLTLPIP